MDSDLQNCVLLEAKAVLEQAGDVGQVHAEEGAVGLVLGHLVTHCRRKDSVLLSCPSPPSHLLDPVSSSV